MRGAGSEEQTFKSRKARSKPQQNVLGFSTYACAQDLTKEQKMFPMNDDPANPRKSSSSSSSSERSIGSMCDWCGKAFSPRTSGGHPQRFCRPTCQKAFHAAGRDWLKQALVDGRVTIRELKACRNADVAEHAPPTREPSSSLG